MDIQEIKTGSINLVAVGNEGGHSVLLIGLKEAYREKPQYQRYLKKEFEACKDLDNQSLVKVNDLKDFADLGTCIETEWDDCRTLADWLKEGNHSEDEKKRVVRQVATAVKYIHSQGKVFGALNSLNILISRKGDSVKVLPIRLRWADILKQPREVGVFLAPEAKDGTVTLDVRADIYSLGMLLKEMGLMGEYNDVIASCCSFGRNERYADVDTFIDGLNHRHYNHESEGELSTAPASSKKMAVIVAVIVVLIGVVVALLVAQGGDDSSDEATVKQSSEQTVTEQPAQTNEADMDSTAKQQLVVTNDSAFTGDNAFLNELVPQMRIDLDKIYNSGADQRTIRRKVAVYYKGLRNVLRKQHKTAAQLDAFDKAFAAYRQSKE